MARTGSQRVGILPMMVASATLAELSFGSSERAVVSNGTGGFGENPIVLRTTRKMVEKIRIGFGFCTLQQTYLFTSPKSQSCLIAVCRSRTNRKRIVHMKKPAKR